MKVKRLNEAQAVERVRKYLARRVKLRVHRQVPAGVALYNFDPANEILVSNESASGYRVGGTAFLSVNTISGEVNFHGHCGE